MTCLVALSCAAACSSPDPGAAPRPGPPRSSATSLTSSPSVTSSAGLKRSAHLGDSVDLGQPGHPQVRLTVDVQALLAEASSASAKQKPADDTSWYAVKVTVTNTGWDTYAGTPVTFTLTDSDGDVHHQLARAGRLSVGAAFTAGKRLVLGERDAGWMVFQLPDGTVPGTLDFHWSEKSAAVGEGWRL